MSSPESFVLSTRLVTMGQTPRIDMVDPTTFP